MSATTVEGTQLEGVRNKVFLDRYSLKNPEGQPLESTPEEMWRRVANAIASVEVDEDRRYFYQKQFYNLLNNFKFVPGGRILSGAGSGHEVTFFNCFVIPQPEDSRGGIFDNLKFMTEIMARGGGVGVNLSTLRPRGSYIKTVNGHSSGPVSWAELYSVTTGGVIQQGGTRRGALMIMLDDDHPDIMEFVTCKRIDPLTNKPVALQYANVSVAVSDTLMHAIKEDADWQTQFPTKANIEKAEREGKEVGPIQYGPILKARELWDTICKSAWATAEPGVVFIERYNKSSNTHYYESIRCVNPCGEQGLGDWQVCNLGALNLAAYVSTVPIGGSGPGDLPGTPEEAAFAYNLLYNDTRTAIRFLDNVIDSTHYFLPQNREAQMGTRRTGLGTMGLADALIKLGVRYGSEESLAVIDRIYSTIRDAAYDASADLALEKGVFEQYDRDEYQKGLFIQSLPEQLREKIRENGVRNAVLLTQAPTGSTSLISGVSSGIEPVFSFAMKRVDRTGESFIYHPLMQSWKQTHPDEPIPDYFVSSGELSPEEHIAVQARIQRYTDSSISKTVNGPNDDTVDDVKRLYMLAYESGCKGVTYYRDGSRDAVLTRIEEDKKEKPTPIAVEMIRERPSVLRGYTRNIHAPEGTVNITINEDENGPFEVFVNVGRAGSDVAALAEALGRLISLSLRLPSTMPPDQRLSEVVNQLNGIGGSRFVGYGPNQVRSLADAVSKALGEHAINRVEEPNFIPLSAVIAPAVTQTVKGRMTGNMCPECNQLTLILQEGCKKCANCGHSEC